MRLVALVPLAVVLAHLSGSVVAVQGVADDVRIEVASIKRATEAPAGSGVGAPNLFVRNFISLEELIMLAYDVPRERVKGGPSWLGSDRFAVIVKTSRSATVDELRVVLQQVLAERFRLRVHRDAREVSTYDLVLSRGDHRPGPQLKPAQTDCMPFLTGKRPMTEAPTITGAGGATVSRCALNISANPATGIVTADLHGVSLAFVADFLQRHAGRPVSDKTGIEGAFDVSLSFADDALPRPLGAERSGDTPSLVTALTESLGLKLKPSQGSVPVVFVDAAEPPTEN